MIWKLVSHSHRAAVKEENEERRGKGRTQPVLFLHLFRKLHVYDEPKARVVAFLCVVPRLAHTVGGSLCVCCCYTQPPAQLDIHAGHTCPANKLNIWAKIRNKTRN